MDSRLYPESAAAPFKPRYVNGILVLPGIPRNLRVRVSTAEVNAGKVILPAIQGFGYRILDCKMIAIGGNAATATSVDIVGTKGGSESRPVVNAIAGLTRSAVLRMGATNSAVLADGVSHTTHDPNTSISVSKQSGGSNLATATAVDVILDYVVE